MRKSAEHRVEVTVDHARRLFLRALKKLNASPALASDLEPNLFRHSIQKMRSIGGGCSQGDGYSRPVGSQGERNLEELPHVQFDDAVFRGSLSSPSSPG
jgi:hypothetical protein